MTQAQSNTRESGPRGPRRRARRTQGQADGDSRLLEGGGTLLADRYRLESRVGRGGMADVWRAHDERLDRTVAVKLLHPHLLPDATSRARFVAEARAAARLAHPGIVSVHDVVEDGDRTAIIFQFVAGESLADRLARDGPLPPDVAARVAGELADALDHAHSAGVIHRDVKPANVVLDGDGRARLVDFGIARVLNEAASRLTADGDAVGTLRYMAPEQLAGGAIDERTDLFGLGLVLVEMLTGRPAFAPTSPIGLLEAERRGLAELPDVPVDLQSIVERLLAFDPDARPQSARLVAEELAGARADSQHAVPRPDVVSGVADPTAAAGARMSGQSEETAIIPIVEPAVTNSGSAAGAVFASARMAADRPEADRPDVVASLMTAAASAGATFRGLGRWLAPSFTDPVDDLETAERVQTATGARARRLGAVGLPGLLGVGMLAGIAIVALAVGAPRLNLAGPTVSNEPGGAVAAPSLLTEATASPTAAPQPADAGGAGGNGKAKGRGKGGR